MRFFILSLCTVLLLGAGAALLTATVHAPELLRDVQSLSPAPEEPVTILAFGDIMLDRFVRVKIEEQGPEYPFALLKEFLQGHDIVVANAEGPFTKHPSVSVGQHDILQFTFATSTLPTLKRLGFTTFSQANNHAYNFGGAAFKESLQAIKDVGIVPFGDPNNETPGPVYQTVRGTTVAFVGYHEFSGTDKNVIVAIQEARKQGAFVIVYPHWGVEYEHEPSVLQKTKAHAFIDAGADLILGAHPHVIQSIEVYNGKAIFYSLGNFIFDQRESGPTSEGISVKVSILRESVSYSIFPHEIHKAQASLLDGERRTTILNFLAEGAVGNEKLKEQIATGTFVLP